MNKKYVKRALAGAAVAAGLVLLDAWILEQYFFQVKTYDIGNNNSTQKLKLVHLTDLHFRKSLSPFYKKLARKLNALQPHLILITGDITDVSGRAGTMRQFFNLLYPYLPVVAIPGNHDHLSRVSTGTLKKVLRQRGGNLLQNTSEAFTIAGHRIMITGVDDFIEGQPSFAAAVQDVGYEKHHLLLVHSPLQHEVIKKEIQNINAKRTKDHHLNIQYVFAGHNHGGQVRFFNFVPVLPVKSGNYVNGWYNNAPPYLYVSKGFGTSAIPFRFFAPSEITVLNYGV